MNKLRKIIQQRTQHLRNILFSETVREFAVKGWKQSSKKYTKPTLANQLLRSRVITYLFWRLPFGETITVKWPRMDQQIITSDPNDLWRPWLESTVGRQGLSWNWRIKHDNKVQIKFRNAIYASEFVLRFAVDF